MNSTASIVPPTSVNLLTGASDTPLTDAIMHFVSYTFDVTVNQSTVNHVVNEMMELQYKCVKPDNQTYILSYIGGTDNNPDLRNEAITHAFIAQFSNSSDRDYYLHQDPVHLAFEASLAGVVGRALAIDFTPGFYAPLSSFALVG